MACAVTVDWGSVADWLMLAVTGGGAWIAVRNLQVVRRIEQGSQLMQIDDKYEVTFQSARKALFELYRCEKHRLKDQPDCETRMAQAISTKLDQLLETGSVAGEADEARKKEGAKALAEYLELMRLPNYLETVGVLHHHGLVEEAALLDLYDIVICRTIGWVLPHVRKRRIDESNPKYLHWAEVLHNKAADRIERSNLGYTDWAEGLYDRIEARRRRPTASK